MKTNKTHLLIGGAVISVMALCVSAATKSFSNKKHRELLDELTDDTQDDDMLGMAYEIAELKEALIRSYTTGSKLREDHKAMRASIIELSGENAPVLEGIGETPENDLYVEAVLERESVLDDLRNDCCSGCCTCCTD